MAQIWQKAHGYTRGGTRMVVEDYPALQWLSDGGCRLELTSRGGIWTVDLTQDECERIAEGFAIEPGDGSQ